MRIRRTGLMISNLFEPSVYRAVKLEVNLCQLKYNANHLMPPVGYRLQHTFQKDGSIPAEVIIMNNVLYLYNIVPKI